MVGGRIVYNRSRDLLETKKGIGGFDHRYTLLDT